MNGIEIDMSNQPSEFAIQPNLCTHDIERLSSFYTELFGAEEEMRVPGKKGPFFVTLRFGGASLGLVDYKQGADAAQGRISVTAFVKNVDDLLPRVKPAGGKVHGKAKDMPWGHRVAHITDPDGNPINLTQQL
jgi:predicted enzyme related to lactoylglutathione lyase